MAGRGEAGGEVRLRAGIETAIYAAAYAENLHARLSNGYPHAWRVADQDAGRPAGDADRLAEWETWCVDLAVNWAETAVELHRQGRRRRA